MFEQSKTLRRAARLMSATATQWAQEHPVFDQLRINQGRILAMLNESKVSCNIQDFEFKAFSQWGEDGIIQHLIRAVPIANKTFIEFGVEDFRESNCRFLMMNNNWAGHVIDGSEAKVRGIKSSYYFWQFELSARAAFITQENINDLLQESGLDDDLGIMSIDLDGIDYWVLKAITKWRPRILVLEYNAVFGAERSITVPYDAAFHRTVKHTSNLYFGASLASLVDLATAKGYALVGTCSAGVNAFFVRADLLPPGLRALTARDGFTPSRTRESRDENGTLTFLSGPARLEHLRGLPVLNTRTQAMETL